MGSYRPERVAEMVHREVAMRLRTDIKDSRIPPISITNVVVTRDLSRATITFLPLGGGEVDKEMRRGLSSVAKVLRGPIGRALRLRYAPELVFEVDTHTDRAFRVSALLEQLRAEREGDEE